MQEIQWHYYPHVAENSITRSFIESQAKRQKRPKTIDAYARNLEDLMQAFAHLGIANLIEATPDQIETYLEYLSGRSPARQPSKIVSLARSRLSPNTIQQRLVTARLFYDFCIYRDHRQNKVNPVPRGNQGYNGAARRRGMVNRPACLPWIPSDSEWTDLITHIMLEESTRNQILILLAYEGALRREEVVSLRLDDFDWAEGFVTIRANTSKSGYQRTVMFSQATGELLKRYLWNERSHILAAFGGEKNGPLFLSESNRNGGRPITLGTFNDIIERVREAVHLPFLTTHTFRHLRCTVLKRCGVDLQDIALYAGHRHVASTQIYIHLAPSEVSQRIRQATGSFDARMKRLIEQGMEHE